MEDSLSEFSRLFRTMTKFVKEKTEDYFGSTTPLDRVLREVSNENTSAIPNSLLREIAKSANDITNYHPIMQNVWTGLTVGPSGWRRIYKSLCLLEYLILLGPNRVVDDCRQAQSSIRNLTVFRYGDNFREEGGGVRQKALLILKFLDDPNTIQPARQKAIAEAEKYVGIEHKPAYDFAAASGFGTGFQTSPQWAELGGAFHTNGSGGTGIAGPRPGEQFPLPKNPYATMQNFQTAEDAARLWGVHPADLRSSSQSPGFSSRGGMPYGANHPYGPEYQTGTGGSSTGGESRYEGQRGGSYSSTSSDGAIRHPGYSRNLGAAGGQQPYDAPVEPRQMSLPTQAADPVFTSGPDWWASESLAAATPATTAEQTAAATTRLSPAAAATVNLLDDEQSSLSCGGNPPRPTDSGGLSSGYVFDSDSAIKTTRTNATAVHQNTTESTETATPNRGSEPTSNTEVANAGVLSMRQTKAGGTEASNKPGGSNLLDDDDGNVSAEGGTIQRPQSPLADLIL